jgi:transcriptional antiterminator RfaH
MSYWACAQLETRRENTALHFLSLNGFTAYLPRIRSQRIMPTRGVVASEPLFRGYAFIWIECGWWKARWSPGVIRLIAAGLEPEHVPDRIIEDLRRREVGGLVELPEAPRFRPGDRVRILRGPFADRLAIYASTRPRERVEILLAMLGSMQRVELPKSDVAAL